MPEKAPPAPAIPAHYRLALALSLAFMAHTLLLAGLPAPLQELPQASAEAETGPRAGPGTSRTNTPARTKAGTGASTGQYTNHRVSPAHRRAGVCRNHCPDHRLPR